MRSPSAYEASTRALQHAVSTSISRIELHVRAELLNRFCGGGAELLSLKLCGIDGVAQAGEARLHVFDGRAPACPR